MSQAPPEELRADESHDVPTESLLVVRAGERLFALPLDRVQEVVPARPLTPIPGAGAAVSGMVNVRGRVLPVVDLAAALHLDSAATGPDHRLLVVQHSGREVGLGVEDVIRIERVAVDDLTALRGALSEGEWMGGTATLEAGEARLLEADRLLESILG